MKNFTSITTSEKIGFQIYKKIDYVNIWKTTTTAAGTGKRGRA